MNSYWCLVVACVATTVGIRPSLALECYECSGNYSSSCGYNFIVDETVSNSTCDGQCITITVEFSYVARNCTEGNLTHVGCYYEDTGQAFVCVRRCDFDYCNGEGTVPGLDPPPPSIATVLTTTTMTTIMTTQTTTTTATTPDPGINSAQRTSFVSSWCTLLYSIANVVAMRIIG